MSKVADLIIEILDMYDDGESPRTISSLLNVPLYIVEDAIADYEEEIEEDF